MGFCSYCGDTTKGNSASCEACRVRNASAREGLSISRHQAAGPIQTFLFSSSGLAVCTLVLLAVAVLVLGPGLIPRSGSGATPTNSEVEPLVRAYLAKRGENCTTSFLSNISVGEFEPRFGGWPIYVSHKTTCRKGSSSMTYDGSDHSERKVAATFVRRGMTGSLQTFKPEFFEKFERDMQREIDKMTQRLKFTSQDSTSDR
jgi:hypothetical protein